MIYNVLVTYGDVNNLLSAWVKPFLTKKAAEDYVKYIFESEGFSTDFKHVSILQEDMLKNKHYNFSTVTSEIVTDNATVKNYIGYRSEVKGIHVQLSAIIQMEEPAETFIPD